MSAEPHPRLPLVLTASRNALEQARKLGFSGCLENEVRDAVARGRIRGVHKLGETTTCFLPEHSLVVVVVRTASPLSGRKCWRPLSVRRLDRGRAA